MQAATHPHDADTEILRKLNADYIQAVRDSDVQRFREILAEDFLNTNPDGTLVDKAGFLEQIARPLALANFEASDVRIRLMGDSAIVHGRTGYTKPDGQVAS